MGVCTVVLIVGGDLMMRAENYGVMLTFTILIGLMMMMLLLLLLLLLCFSLQGVIMTRRETILISVDMFMQILTTKP